MLPLLYSSSSILRSLLIGLLVIYSLGTGCSYFGKEEEQESTTSPTEKENRKILFSFEQNELNQSTKAVISQKLGKWLSFHQLTVDELLFTLHQDPKPDPFMEYTETEEAIDSTNFFPGDKQDMWWDILYPYSPNQQYILDIHDYDDISMSEQDEIIIQATEPDSKVDLWDVKKYRAFRIRFCGTPCFYEEANFLDDEVMILAGIEEGASSEENNFDKYPFIELIHIQTGESSKFRATQAAQNDSYDYLTGIIRQHISQ